jgi:small subunit ribosomal protein S17
MAEKKMKEKKNRTEGVLKVSGETISTRGRIFQGKVTKKFDRRAVIEFERTVYVPKYERYYKKKTKIHARIPDSMQVEIGDYVRAQECRPLSKIINFLVIEILRKENENKNESN